MRDLHRIDCSIDGLDQDLVSRRPGLFEVVNDLRLRPGLFEDHAFHVGSRIERIERIEREGRKKNAGDIEDWKTRRSYFSEVVPRVYIYLHIYTHIDRPCTVFVPSYLT